MKGKHLKYRSILAVPVLVLALAGCSGTDAATDEAVTTAPPAAAPPAAKPAPADSTTPAQKNALAKAESYVSMMAFSKTGLVKQLEFDKFATKDAKWAVDRLKVDWKDQAVKKAQSYLDTMAFSRQALVDQLVFDGFTAAEAEHGVKATGL